MRAYVDSDILIWHLRGERRAAAFLRALSAELAHRLGPVLHVGLHRGIDVVRALLADQAQAPGRRVHAHDFQRGHEPLAVGARDEEPGHDGSQRLVERGDVGTDLAYVQDGLTSAPAGR
jgi:hypothetical protein